MKKILILAGRYLPGYKDGGPVRTLINLIDLLGDEYDFCLAVLDRDHGDTESYPNIKVNEWNQVGKAKVWYYCPGEMKFSLIRKLAKEADLIYLCSFYDDYGYKTLILNRLGMLFGKPVILASMGVFSKGALAQKSLKKKVFISFCKCIGLFKKIKWSVTSEIETEDIERKLGRKAEYIIAEDPPRSVIRGHNGSMSEKGKIKIGFVARICRHKNLRYLISVLRSVSAEVELTIGGVIQEEDYWLSCEDELRKLPSNIKWSYIGEIESEKVPEFFAKQDALVLPTLSENYCHVVFEALSSGCIPIISDQTPWNWIQDYGCGYVLPLANQQGFADIISKLANMSFDEKEKISKKSIQAAKLKLQQTREHTGYRDIFDWSLR